MNSVCKTFTKFIKNRRAIALCGFIFFGFLVSILGAGKILAETQPASSSAPSIAANNQDLINEKLEEIKKIQGDIAKYQADIKAKQSEGKSLKNEIAIYDNNINKNQLEIEETKANIEKTELEIGDAKDRIKEDDSNIESSRTALKSFIQDLYGYQQDSMIEILMSKGNLSDFMNEVNSMQSVQDKVVQMVSDLRKEKSDLTARNQSLEDSQEDYQNLINIKQEQNSSIAELKTQKDEMLKITHGQEGQYQSLIASSRGMLPSLQAELRNLQSLGSDIKFDDAISASKYVGGVTGVRPALLLGILRVESGLGTNVGGGIYSIDMSPSQRPVFESIATELGYDPNAMPVSKRPSSYAGWGGAMGPAQMMPSTWLIYKDEVSQIVKKSPPDPWNLTDSIAAIAVKLSKVEGVTSGDYNAEYKAAGMYMGGVNWQKYPFYPNKVMYYADLYQKELGG